MAERRGRRPPGRPSSKAKAARRQDKETTLKLDDLDHGETEIPLHLFAKGRILKRYLQCGKKDCACHKGGKKHGPYHYLVVTVPVATRRPGGPKQKWFYLTKEEAQRFRARIRNFNLLANNMFADLLDELRAERKPPRRKD